MTSQPPVIDTIHPDDNMFDDGQLKHYLHVGESAIHCIKAALFSAGRSEDAVRSILDFACGHGRVLRHLATAFPHASLTACDILRGGVDFCVKTFRAEGVYSDANLDRVSFRKGFDLIWCGSLLTHVEQSSWPDLIDFLTKHLNDDGVLVYTVTGHFIRSLICSGKMTYGLDEEQQKVLIEGFDDSGLGFVRYEPHRDYGVSMVSRTRAFACLEDRMDLRIVSYVEKGWDDHQDVIAVMKQDLERC